MVGDAGDGVEVGEEHLHGVSDREKRARQRGRRKRDRVLRTGHRRADRDDRWADHRLRKTRRLRSRGRRAKPGKWSSTCSKRANRSRQRRGRSKKGNGRRRLATALKSGKTTFTAYRDREKRAGQRRRRKRDGVLRSRHAGAVGDDRWAAVAVEEHRCRRSRGPQTKRAKWWCTCFEAAQTKGETASRTVEGGKWSATLSTALTSREDHVHGVSHREERAGQRRRRKRDAWPSKSTRWPPSVTIVAPKSPSKNQTPSFVRDGERSRRSGRPRARRGHTGRDGFGDGQRREMVGDTGHCAEVGKTPFTAFATEKSGLGNEEGESSTVSFEVDTLSPSVTIVGPPSPSKNTDAVVLGRRERSRRSRRARLRRVHRSRQSGRDRQRREMVGDAHDRAEGGEKHLHGLRDREKRPRKRTGDHRSDQLRSQHRKPRCDDRGAAVALERQDAVVLGDGERSRGSGRARPGSGHAG